MKLKFLYIILCFVGYYLNAQQEFHVFPIDDKDSPGSVEGDGSLSHPWDLQTALSQNSDTVNSGDTIWLHEGVYNGRFISTLESLEPNQYITVSAYKNDTVVLNGNVTSTRNAVLEVKGQQVIFKNFEVTWLGDFSRHEKDDDFEVCSGIRHLTGINCRFYNLKIYNNPGLGFGSWKHSAGSIIENCMIYNNGYIAKNGKGRGEGIYVQNNSNQTRVISNCIIYNNFYKGIEVWSANKNAKEAYVKNILIKNTVVFNSGSPSGYLKDNLIVASGDRNGINIAQDIQVLDNFLYHNTNVANSEINGDAASLTLGFNPRSPIENVIVKNNYIIGRNNALRILYAKSLTFSDNVAYTGYVLVDGSFKSHVKNWDFKDNLYYTKKGNAFRSINDKDYKIQNWKSEFNLDSNSRWSSIKNFQTSFSSVTPFSKKNDAFKVVLFDENRKDIPIDFSDKDVKVGQSYKIYDVENSKVILRTGTLLEDRKITFSMELNDFEQPLHNTKAIKTLSNFGVFIVKFDDIKQQKKVKRDNAFKRFFRWLGF
ncbi:right-handed parallel beta-helix repeat-containing protein [Psychroserpens sp. MEBiC05023]